MSLNIQFHHIGVACTNLEKEMRAFAILGYSPCFETFVDAKQKIRGQFISAPGQPMLELIENLDQNGPVTSCLRRGIKLYHQAYSTENIEYTLESFMAQYRCKVLAPPVKATFFERVCFLMLPNTFLVEFVELKHQSSESHV